MTNHRTGPSAALLSIIAVSLACQSGPLANVHAARGEPVALAQLTGSLWSALEIGGQPVVTSDGGRKRPSLVFKNEREVFGSAGCNDFSGAASGESAGLKFGPFATTRKACADEIMEQEQRYLKALTAGGRLESALQSLYLIGADGETSVRFERAFREAELE